MVCNRENGRDKMILEDADTDTVITVFYVQDYIMDNWYRGNCNQKSLRDRFLKSWFKHCNEFAFMIPYMITWVMTGDLYWV